MNRIETIPPATKPFPIVSLLVSAGVALGLVCVIGCLVVLAGILGKTKNPTAPSSLSVAFTGPSATERDRIVGTWRTEGWINGLPCTYRVTFGPTTTYAFTIECTLSNGTVLPPGHGSYFYGDGDLRWTLTDIFGFSHSSITWLDDNRYTSTVLESGNPSMVNQQYTFTRVR